MKTILLNTLATLAAEQGKGFDRSFRLVNQLLQEYGEEDLAERLYRDLPAGCPWEVAADLFGILVWSTADNGAALTRTTEEWLRQGDDLRKVRIALHLDVYPFLDRAEMERVLERVAARHPEVASLCRETIASRRVVSEGREMG